MNVDLLTTAGLLDHSVWAQALPTPDSLLASDTYTQATDLLARKRNRGRNSGGGFLFGGICCLFFVVAVVVVSVLLTKKNNDKPTAGQLHLGAPPPLYYGYLTQPYIHPLRLLPHVD